MCQIINLLWHNVEICNITNNSLYEYLIALSLPSPFLPTILWVSYPSSLPQLRMIIRIINGYKHT